MVKHVILWQLKDELSAEEKAAVKAGIKEGLESLSGKIPGLVDIHVNIDALPSSNADLMLDTTFESAEALKGYSTHPAHVAVANSKVRPYYKKPRLSGLRGLIRDVCGRSGMLFYGMNLRKKGHCTVCAMTLLLSGNTELTERTPRCTQSRTLPAAS